MYVSIVIVFFQLFVFVKSFSCNMEITKAMWGEQKWRRDEIEYIFKSQLRTRLQLHFFLGCEIIDFSGTWRSRCYVVRDIGTLEEVESQKQTTNERMNRIRNRDETQISKERNCDTTNHSRTVTTSRKCERMIKIFGQTLTHFRTSSHQLRDENTFHEFVVTMVS